MSSSSPMMGMRVGADGGITYDFDGHVNALGLDLPATETETGAEESDVSWYHPDTLEVLAKLYTYFNEHPAPSDAVDLRITTQPQQEEFSSTRLTLDTGGSHIQLAGHPFSKGIFPGEISFGAGDDGGLLMDTIGRSSFLRLAGPAGNWKVNFGEEFCHWEAFQAQSNFALVEHGIELEGAPFPVLAGAFGLGEEGSRLTTWNCIYRDTKYLVFRGNSTAAFPSNVDFPFCWIAIG